jgi:hypothetical protein
MAGRETFLLAARRVVLGLFADGIRDLEDFESFAAAVLVGAPLLAAFFLAGALEVFLSAFAPDLRATNVLSAFASFFLIGVPYAN